MDCTIIHIGTATILLQIGSIRLLTDPVFDPPGGRYNFGYGTNSIKLTAPTIKAENIGKIDAILLSHDHHEDNLDRAGRALLPLAREVLTTSIGAKRLGNNSIGLKSWESRMIPGEDSDIKVTAVPARHGSLGSHLIVGETTGFILEWAEQKYGALYISGDTVWFNGIHEIAHRFQVGTAILHIGKASFPATGPIHFTLNAKEAVRVVKTFNPRSVIPIHYEGWNHFREPKAEAEKEFVAAGIKERVIWLPLGGPLRIEL